MPAWSAAEMPALRHQRRKERRPSVTTCTLRSPHSKQTSSLKRGTRVGLLCTARSALSCCCETFCGACVCVQSRRPHACKRRGDSLHSLLRRFFDQTRNHNRTHDTTTTHQPSPATRPTEHMRHACMAQAHDVCSKQLETRVAAQMLGVAVRARPPA
jgi:hypothetical protein